MRIVTVMVAAALLIGGAVVVATRLLTPEPAAVRLAGVSVAVGGRSVADLGPNRHRLTVDVTVAADRSLPDCVAFALDSALRDRVMEPANGSCVRPAAGPVRTRLVLDELTDDDLAFSAHTLLWGVAGGRCGPLLELIGVCEVDTAGSIPLDLPVRSSLPTFGPIGSLFPSFSIDVGP